jgi:hypothetical protein
VVPPASHPISRVGRYSRNPSTPATSTSPTGLSPAAATRSSGVRLYCRLHASGLLPAPIDPSNPPTTAPAGSYAVAVWALPRSLAATEGILSFPRGTEMFQFPRFPSGLLRMTGYHPRRVVPFGDPGIAGCQRLPRAFRRVATSFLGNQRQGIHRVPIIPACTGRAHRASFPPGMQDTLPEVCQDHPKVTPTRLSRWAEYPVCSPAHGMDPTPVDLSRCRRWSRGGSNPEPPPCKGGALPVELRPRWARLDSNQGPRPYQGRALTS